ncbi:hypothetical protein [Nocardia niwae]|uniref:Uncharacterized protein n=1 Tax=Nocardia niwae TaxID=626084 RepID=A0ABV2X7W0_9NOCA|nr:hypothetical protein [Nocardia niwae]
MVITMMDDAAETRSVRVDIRHRSVASPTPAIRSLGATPTSAVRPRSRGHWSSVMPTGCC